METQILLETALRAVGVYALVLVVVRMMGKRAIGNFSAFDLLVAMMIGEVVDEIIYGNVPFMRGVVPILVVAGLHEANAWLSYSSSRMQRVLEGTPTVVVRDGQLDRQGMRSERVSESDVFSHLRIGGVTDLAEVKKAIVENDGKLSVILQDWAEPARKADIDETAASEARKRRAGGIRTDSSHALDADG